MTGIQKQIYDMLMESQFWPLEQMVEFQRSQLTQLLLHAKRNVPFYKSRLDPVFKKNGEIDWGRWHEIPIVTRADLRDRRDEMLATALPPGHGPSKSFSTSGSSGVPISVEVTKIWTLANRAAIIRFFDNHSIDTSWTRASFKRYDKDGKLRKDAYHEQKWGKVWQEPSFHGREFVINPNLPIDQQLQLIAALGVSYISAYTNNAELLANANLQSRTPVRLNTVGCFGQGLTSEQRKLFQMSFGARSLSVYSSKEGGLMGCQCEKNEHHLHVNAENINIELVDPNGQVCTAGKRGRVVITPFFSSALPLIRYDQGDVAEFVTACSCDSKLPILREIDGKNDQLILLAAGPRSAAALDTILMRTNLNALAIQLAQVKTSKIEIRYVPAQPFKDIIAAPIISHIHDILDPELEVVFKPVEKIPLNSGGKQQRIVCEID